MPKAETTSRQRARTTTKKAARPITALRVGSQLVKAGRGHVFKRVGNGIALMKGRSTQATFTCECTLSGGCRVQMEDQTATCLENGCSGSCGWVVNIPGIAGVAKLAVLRG